jgi:cytochrome c oxidase subunit 4
LSLPETPDIEKHTEAKQPNYLGVFLALAVLTAIEIGVTYYLPDQRVYFLVPLALIKAGLVVLYFMHLKFDRKVFVIVFVIGVLMGISLIIVMSLLFAPLLGFGSR